MEMIDASMPQDRLTEDVNRSPAAPKGEAPLYRYRIVFSKTGTLRFISHNDLLRVWDRLLRRTGLPMKLSQGFHTKLKVSSPLSLALGIEGLAEILDIELSSPLPIEEVRLRLESERVEGLGIVDVQPLDRASARARVTAQEYLCRVPGDVDESALRRRAEELLSGPCLIVDRRTPGKPDRQVDIRPRIDTLAVQDHEIRMRLWVTDGASARPEEVLRALGLQDTINEGSLAVTRTQVELTRRDDLSALPAHG